MDKLGRQAQPEHSTRKDIGLEYDDDGDVRGDDQASGRTTEWPQPEAGTGDGNVDNILARLQDLPRLPSSEHTEAYTEVHDQLMAELDAGDGSD